MLESRVQIVHQLSNPAQLLYVFFLKVILERVSFFPQPVGGMRQH